MFHLLVYISSLFNSKVWARLKPRARNSILASHMDVKDTSTRAISCCLSSCINKKVDQTLQYQMAVWLSDGFIQCWPLKNNPQFCFKLFNDNLMVKVTSLNFYLGFLQFLSLSKNVNTYKKYIHATLSIRAAITLLTKC